jgi:hypothetical protein
MNTDIIESANISSGPSREIFLLYYKEYSLLDRKRNEEILGELKVEPVDEKL